MRWLVFCSVGGVCEQNSIMKNVNVDDWTVKLAVIGSNALIKFIEQMVCELKSVAVTSVKAFNCDLNYYNSTTLFI